MSAVYLAQQSNFGAAIDYIIQDVNLPGCEQSYEPGWETTPEHTIHILSTSLFGMGIVATSQSTDVSGSCALGSLYILNTRLLENKNQDLQ